MSNINFKPWIGKNYLTKGFQGKRILVLGESHYCSKELSEGGRCYPLCKRELMNVACFTQTQDVVREAVYDYGGQRYLQAFLCFERAVAGKVLSQEEREKFWESVMFYNYIQYSPDYIIVWGVRLYNGLPGFGGEGHKLTLDNGDYNYYWNYTINGKVIPALKIHHPSAPTGKNWEYWHEVIFNFLSHE